jgi:hypothetical protein
MKHLLPSQKSKYSNLDFFTLRIQLATHQIRKIRFRVQVNFALPGSRYFNFSVTTSEHQTMVNLRNLSDSDTWTRV